MVEHQLSDEPSTYSSQLSLHHAAIHVEYILDNRIGYIIGMIMNFLKSISISKLYP